MLDIDQPVAYCDHEGFGSRGHFQFRQYAGDVDLYCSLRDAKRGADFLIEAAFRDQFQHLFFAFGKLRENAFAHADREFWRDIFFSGMNPTDGIKEPVEFHVFNPTSATGGF